MGIQMRNKGLVFIEGMIIVMATYALARMFIFPPKIETEVIKYGGYTIYVDRAEIVDD